MPAKLCVLVRGNNPRTRLLVLIAFCLLGASRVFAGKLETIDFKVEGVSRQALIYFPENKNSSAIPVIIAYHGHGGTSREASEQFKCEAYWPDSIVVYPQGLDTPGTLIDRQGLKTGWQSYLGDQNDRDIKFFDSIIDYLKSTQSIDLKRIFVLGHSNGGLFVFELWAARGDELAATGCISAVAPKELRPKLKPLPYFHVAGRNDPLVRFPWQQETIHFIETLNQCETASPAQDGLSISKTKSNGCDVGIYIWSGGHQIPPEAVPYSIDFFKHTLE